MRPIAICPRVFKGTTTWSPCCIDWPNVPKLASLDGDVALTAPWEGDAIRRLQRFTVLILGEVGEFLPADPDDRPIEEAVFALTGAAAFTTQSVIGSPPCVRESWHARSRC
ncbi:MAG: hypothetical protein DLM71_02365 [Chloroflexi bacterium]|nr:MAG: hypothetical protein DLM71_02365 [Chloroflexota bacterium]